MISKLMSKPSTKDEEEAKEAKADVPADVEEDAGEPEELSVVANERAQDDVADEKMGEAEEEQAENNEEEQDAFAVVADGAEVAEEGVNAVGEAVAEMPESQRVFDDGNEINVEFFEELKIESGLIGHINDAWQLFVSSAESRESAGEAIFAAVFEAAPSLQPLFTSPRAVQAMRFMNALASFVTSLEDPPKLKLLVETIGFGHLHLEVTKPRVTIFRDAILDLFAVELGERFNEEARAGWFRLLNYVGGAIIYVKAKYADRINTLLESWKNVNSKGSTDDTYQQLNSADMGRGFANQQGNADNKGKGRGWRPFAKKKEEAKAQGSETTKAKVEEQTLSSISDNQIPSTYNEMFKFNAASMGIQNNMWLNEVLCCFDNIVSNVANSSRLQEECDILVLRISKVAKGKVDLSEYKSCMLSSLRSLLPKEWSMAHEVAWTWLWDNVERLIAKNLGNPRRWERALSKLYDGLDDNASFEFRKSIYMRFFAAAPAGQDFFKQSNTYLHFIAERIMVMTLELYRDPVKLVDDISAIGLRHVGYGIPTELFGPYVSASCAVVQNVTKDPETLESYRWSLALIAKITMRTITEGSTIVMKAVNKNSAKELRKAINCAPRIERASWLLIVRVGTQDISPLSWAIESGAHEAAQEMIIDLLTIRADRDRYYFHMDQLFNRHPDIIKRLCNNAPELLPKLLDGLIWRSRMTENGERRVNYYIRHLVSTEEGRMSPALAWIAKTMDPKISCHPAIVFASDTVWSGIACQAFLYRKLWLLFTLLVFITGQSIFKHLNEGENSRVERIMVFAFRTFIYTCSMTQLMYAHLTRWLKAYRSKDTRTVCGKLAIPRYLGDWQEAAGFFLMCSLFMMLMLEPIMYCFGHDEGKIFYEECSEAEEIQFPYSIFSVMAMFLYYSLLINLAVLSTKVSAYVLVCIRMLSEMGLFLLAMFAVTLTFSSCITILKQRQEDFSGIHQAFLTLAQVFFHMYDGDRYEVYEIDPVLLACVLIFMVLAAFFIVNMLIAQLTCAYESVYIDMVGYARLERLQVIVGTMPSVSEYRWQRFLATLKFGSKVEFNAGDLGVSGGMQELEAASLNPTTIDKVVRYGGSTSPGKPWPADEEDIEEESDLATRYENLIQKTFKKVTSHNKKGEAGGSMGTGTGTLITGSNHSQSKDLESGSGSGHSVAEED